MELAQHGKALYFVACNISLTQAPAVVHVEHGLHNHTEITSNAKLKTASTTFGQLLDQGIFVRLRMIGAFNNGGIIAALYNVF